MLKGRGRDENMANQSIMFSNCNLQIGTNLLNINNYRAFKIFVVFFGQPQEIEVS